MSIYQKYKRVNSSRIWIYYQLSSRNPLQCLHYQKGFIQNIPFITRPLVQEMDGPEEVKEESNPEMKQDLMLLEECNYLMRGNND